MKKERIYIKRIEMIDFEAHGHLVLDGFSEGFNVIVGPSNVGKTSVLRALKLCAYNEFNPESVRIGAKFCRVIVTTTAGEVDVRRGEGINNWTVTRNGLPPQVFDRVGTKPVAEACTVLGMKEVEAGDVRIPVNIMDQLESHFLLSSIGGAKATGSLKAQIIDEICGLHGAEGLIKAMSQDHLSTTKRMNEAERALNDLEARLNPEDVIANDERRLKELRLRQYNIEVCGNNIAFLRGFLDDYARLSDDRDGIDGRMAALKYDDRVSGLCDEASGILKTLETHTAVLDAYRADKEKLDGIVRRDACLPNPPDFSVVEELQEQFTRYNGIANDYKQNSERLADIEARLGAMGDADTDGRIKDVQVLVLDTAAYTAIKREYDGLRGSFEALQDKVDLCLAELSDAEGGIAEIYRNLDVCPVTGSPIGEACSLAEERKRL